MTPDLERHAPTEEPRNPWAVEGYAEQWRRFSQGWMTPAASLAPTNPPALANGQSVTIQLPPHNSWGREGAGGTVNFTPWLEGAWDTGTKAPEKTKKQKKCKHREWVHDGSPAGPACADCSWRKK